MASPRKLKSVINDLYSVDQWNILKYEQESYVCGLDIHLES